MDNFNGKRLPGTVLPTATGQNVIIAETSDGKLWKIDSGGAKELLDKSAAIDLFYPVGKLYISIDSASPSALFGGTWTQITNDAYLKIVTSNAGSVGGTSSDHKMPVSSMPSHNHDIVSPSGQTLSVAFDTPAAGYAGSEGNSGNSTLIYSITNTGGGQPYYPYYYGIYLWRRTA